MDLNQNPWSSPSPLARTFGMFKVSMSILQLCSGVDPQLVWTAREINGAMTIYSSRGSAPLSLLCYGRLFWDVTKFIFLFWESKEHISFLVIAYTGTTVWEIKSEHDHLTIFMTNSLNVGPDLKHSEETCMESTMKLKGKVQCHTTSQAEPHFKNCTFSIRFFVPDHQSAGLDLAPLPSKKGCWFTAEKRSVPLLPWCLLALCHCHIWVGGWGREAVVVWECKWRLF